MGDRLQEGKKSRAIALGDELGNCPIADQGLGDKVRLLRIGVAIVDFLAVGASSVKS
jgi:hypothetical protein